jgi:hypothetical protein
VWSPCEKQFDAREPISNSGYRFERTERRLISAVSGRSVGAAHRQKCRPGNRGTARGPIFLRADGQRLDRHGAERIVRRIAKRAGITKPISLHTLRHRVHRARAGPAHRPVDSAGER